MRFFTTIIFFIPGFLIYSQDQLYTIPVVVHVVWKDSQENISDEKIAEQLLVLNRDFRHLNCEIPLIEPEFQPLAADVGFEFCLATKDPDGQPTNGITRTKTDIDEIGKSIHPSSGKRRIYYTDLGGADAWDTEQYLNIWVCDMGENSENGFGSRPGINIPEEDGILCDPRYFGFTTTPGHQLGRTLTHETGHYFDLVHIWGTNSDCSDDDGVEDTPLQTGPHFGCGEEVGLCPGVTTVMTMNFMDYADDDCMALFTEGQKTRMVAALTGPRSALWQSSKCQSHIDPDNINFRLFPNPAEEQLTFELENPFLQICRLDIYDVSGRLYLRMENRSSSINLDCRLFPAGVYILNAELSNGERLLERLVVR